MNKLAENNITTLSYENAIKDLTSQGKFYINLGLERISEILSLLGNPQDNLHCIQVAGTNGKGSVCTILASVLKEAGYKTGLYTSPHLFEYTERIQINNEMISKNDFVNYYSEIISIAEKNKIHLTEFEILTAIMFKYFSDNNVEIAIIETGLGGRFDATNVLKTNLCSIITHIDLDHTDRLGDTKEKIAFEKAGIIKPNSIVITSEGYEVIHDKADNENAMFVLTSPYCEEKYLDALSLKGEHQAENLAPALNAINLLFPNVSEDVLISGLKKVKNPCRFQYIKEKNLIVDGGHNPNCITALRNNLDRYYPHTKKQYIFGCLNTKDYEKMINLITSDKTMEQIYFYTFKNNNSCDFETLSKIYPQGKKLKTIDDIEFNNSILTVICGSFYMINELLPKEIIFQQN